MSLINVGKSTFENPNVGSSSVVIRYRYMVTMCLTYAWRLKVNSDLQSQTVCAAAAVLGCMTGITKRNSERPALRRITIRLALPYNLPLKPCLPKY